MVAGLLSAVLLTLSACSGGDTKSLQSQVDSLLTLTSRQQGDLNDMESFVSVLAEGLDTIARQEGMLFFTNKGPEQTIVDRNQLKQNLELFANTLAEQRQKIQQMSDSLKARGASVEKLQALVDFLNAQIDEKDRMITQLRSELEQKNVDIAQLRGRVGSLSKDNTKLSQQVKSQQEELKVQKAKAGVGFIVMGSAKVLKEYGVTTGGGLFAKAKVNYENLPRELFTQVDMHTFGGLEIPSAKAKLLSGNPASSYEIVKTGKESSELHILDPDVFWSNSRYVVIQTK